MSVNSFDVNFCMHVHACWCSDVHGNIRQTPSFAHLLTYDEASVVVRLDAVLDLIQNR
jgi:hypothetical protein